jgi:hypothetical protein
MSDFLKGNFTVKKPVIEAPVLPGNAKQELAEKLKKQVLTSLGGSMVYMERTGLTWDGDKGEQSSERK